MLDPRQMSQPLSLHLKMKKEDESDNREGLFSASSKKKLRKISRFEAESALKCFFFQNQQLLSSCVLFGSRKSDPALDLFLGERSLNRFRAFELTLLSKEINLAPFSPFLHASAVLTRPVGIGGVFNLFFLGTYALSTRLSRF